jgi:ATP-dependent DNA ligase
MNKELDLLIEIEGLSGAGSQKVKQDLIRDNMSPELETIIRISFDPFLTTKLHKLEVLPESSNDLPTDTFPTLKDLSERLFVAPAANDSLRKEAHDLVNRSPLTQEQRKMLAKILTKRVNIGIGAKLINKAVGKPLVPDPSLMLAEDDESQIAKWSNIVIEEKYDGVRVIAIVKGDDVAYFTRSFNELPGRCLQKITREIRLLLNGIDVPHPGIFFDGELTDLNRKSVSGKVTQMLKGNPADSIGDDMLYNIFDVEEAQVLETGKGVNPFYRRRELLETMFKNNKWNLIVDRLIEQKNEKVELTSLVLANSITTDDHSLIHKTYKELVDVGGEGVIVKSPDHLYECKRSKSWIKIKEVNDCDLIIKGWYPGEGKREGYIGGLICEDSSGEVKVKVGSGFTEEDLKTLSQDPDGLVGKIAACQYNVVINDKTGGWSLFLPRFIEVRTDKDEADDMRGLLK